MFDTSVRQHPVQTFQFWFVVLTCFVGVTAWKLNAFAPPSVPVAELTEEPMPPPTDDPIFIAEAETGTPFSDSGLRSNKEPADAADTDSSIAQAPQQLEESSPEVQSALPAPERQKLMQTASLDLTVSENDGTEKTVTTQTVTGQTATAQFASDQPADSQIVQVSAQQLSSTELQPSPSVNRSTSSSSAIANPLIDLAEVDRLVNLGEEVAAQRLLSSWYWKHPELRPKLMDRLNVLARRIYFTPEIHYTDPHQVRFGEKVEGIAQKYRVSPEYLIRLNRLTAATPLKAAQPLKVIQGPFSAVVDVSDLEMTIHAQGYYVARFPVGFGNETPIPHGKFRIAEKQLDPAYNSPDGLIPAAHPANPLGTRRIGLRDEHGTLSAFAIHGTSDSGSIGRLEGQGGLRLKPSDVEAVYDLLTVDSELIIHP